MKTYVSVVRGFIVPVLLAATASIALATDVPGNRLNIGDGNSLAGTDSSIAGGFTNKVTASYSTIAGGSANVASNFNDFIGGGSENLITDDNAAIVGGEVNTVGSYDSFIGGGSYNTINSTAHNSTLAGGYQNTVSSNYVTLSGGYNNSASGYLSTIGGGYINTNSGLSGTIGGGTQNTASGSYSTIAGGASAIASLYGQSTHANGGFGAPGEAQASEFILRNVTTTTNTTELFLDGTSARMTMPTNGTWVFDIMVAVRGTNGVSGGFRTNGVIKRVSGTTTLVGAGGGSMAIPVIAADLGTWSATVNTDTNLALTVKVTGPASSTNRWVATVRTTEVRQ